ncbi:sacsin N-terminal ATP-binding-like domain-containing protein [Streptomyces sp. NPDC058701]|uniref:sacsin N-terminal ATP-binding-like domain-containing protein n=1 Tax=Streptomyces sp. NPDC058701 TaxID=3346608 RepID=UPI0036656DF0
MAAQREVGEAGAVQWAERLFRKKVKPELDVPEPRGAAATRKAVERFGELYADIEGVVQESLEGARAAAKQLSSDPLQGLSEVVQNAEDLGAREVRIMISGGELLLAHDGDPVRLRDVMPLSMPWVTSKAADARATGRFGIGLMTLYVFSPWIEVHSGHYGLRIAESGLSWAPPREFPRALVVEGDGDRADRPDRTWTVFRIPLRTRRLAPSDVDAWLRTWGHAALLFLRSVSRVTHLDPKGRVRPSLGLERVPDGGFTAEVAGQGVEVDVAQVRDPDGLHWQVCRATVATPPGVAPMRKAAAETVDLGVAVPVGGAKGSVGHVHVGLPVTGLALPLRLHAPFDPLPNRQGLSQTDWNDALVARVADLWAAALVDRFHRDPATAWPVLPLPTSGEVREGGDRESAAVVTALEQAVLARSRAQVCARMTVEVPGRGPMSPGELALEVAALTGVLTEADVERVADRPALPVAARDDAGRYREVLADWKTHGAGADGSPPAPRTVDVWDAMVLLRDQDRPLEAAVELAAVGVADGASAHRLATYAWLVDDVGVYHRPPGQSDLRMFTSGRGGLAAGLGFAHVLHPVFLADTPAATAVRNWLRAMAALLTEDDPAAVLRRLSAYGRRRFGSSALALTDEQLVQLKDAFDRVPDGDRRNLGPGVGMAVLLKARQYDDAGTPQEGVAPPAQAYLPTGIEGTDRLESFAHAAGTTPGLWWIRPRYHQVLRSGGAAGGLSPQAFLRLLGAEGAPRLREHAQQVWRLHRNGLAPNVLGTPAGRTRAMAGSEFTLDDLTSPDLAAVARSIAADPDPVARRQRAIALIRVLARTWGSRFAGHERVEHGDANRRWYLKPSIPAFWLWQLREIPWLDNDLGEATAPGDGLRLRTTGTTAVYGADPAGFLHRDVQQAVGRRADVLRALGIGGEPTVGDILAHLRKNREAERAGGARDVAGARILYEALAERMAAPAAAGSTASATTTTPASPDGVVPRELVAAFAAGDGLVLTAVGWRRPAQCLRGTPLFGRLRAFAPTVRCGEALWRAVGVREPDADDAVGVIKELAPATTAERSVEPSAADQTVLLQSLQFLQNLAAHDPNQLAGLRLDRLPLWTGRGWVTQRPVYAVEDESVVAGLAAVLAHDVAIWRPGAELEHFRELLPRLRVACLGRDEVRPLVPGDGGEPAPRAAALVAAAVGHLHEDLQRNDPGAAREILGSWDELAGLAVRVAPELTCTVTFPAPRAGVAVPAPAEVPMDLAVDWQTATLYTRDLAHLARPGTGRALAAGFRGHRRAVAQAWCEAWEKATAGMDTTQIVRAEDLARAEEAAAQEVRAQRLAAFRQETAAAADKQPKPPQAGGATASRPPAAPGTMNRAVGRLVNTDGLKVVRDRVQLTPPRAPRPAQPPTTAPARPTLSEPRANTAPPRQRSAPVSYTPVDQEDAAMTVVRKILAGDDARLRDLRTQRGLGADAVDELGRFYEVKSVRKKERDSVTVTPHEWERARTEKDFFLVVVSGLDSQAEQTVARFILDPYEQLTARPSPNIVLSGIRAACQSLRYTLEPGEGSSQGDHDRGNGIRDQ